MRHEARKLAIVLVTTILSLGLHSLIPTEIPITEDTLSALASSLSFVGVVTLFFLVAYFVIASVFLKYESRLNGPKFARALTFGLLVGGIWWVGMLESVFAFGTRFAGEVLTGLFDFIPIVVLCLLLAAFVVKDKPAIAHERVDYKQAAINSGIFLAVFVGGRVIRYIGGIGGYHPENIMLTVLWTASFAGVILLNYAAFRMAAACGSPLRSALQFSLVIFGLHYTLFAYFLPLVFKGLVVAATIGLAYDLLLVLLSSWVCNLTAAVSSQHAARESSVLR